MLQRDNVHHIRVPMYATGSKEATAKYITEALKTMHDVKKIAHGDFKLKIAGEDDNGPHGFPFEVSNRALQAATRFKTTKGITSLELKGTFGPTFDFVHVPPRLDELVITVTHGTFAAEQFTTQASHALKRTLETLEIVVAPDGDAPGSPTFDSDSPVLDLSDFANLKFLILSGPARQRIALKFGTNVLESIVIDRVRLGHDSTLEADEVFLSHKDWTVAHMGTTTATVTLVECAGVALTFPKDGRKVVRNEAACSEDCVTFDVVQ